MTDQDLRPPKQRARAEQGSNHSAGTSRWLMLVLAIAAVGYGGWYAREYWAAKDRSKAQESLSAPATPAPSISAPEEPPAPLQPLTPAPSVNPPAAVEAEPAAALPGNPVEPSDDALAGSEAAAVDQLVVQWLGSQALQFVVTPGLAHHIVATVDNLPRSHAAPRLWPLNPVGGKIVVQEDAQGTYIAPANSARYDAVVSFVTSIDPAQAVQWYRSIYPVLQQTYENLGYPGKHFNDRLVAVIDHLLQTPHVQEPLALRLVEVQGQEKLAVPQPWLRYEYADVQLQSLSAGQKILLRLGVAHRQRISAYLQAVRAQVAA